MTFGTEYLENPLGIDSENPRFAYSLRSDYINVMQQGYRMIVSDDLKNPINLSSNRVY